ncbi:MAG: hypothetical protein EOO39_09285 [Cytophagaceae bacterium]|nr:MAG: hypothetical protein EOO39_09285 [Cytophagaceae bacterium]
MRMDTQQLMNLEISLQELIDAFKQLPPQCENQTHRYPIKFTVQDGYGNPCERELLFYWNAEQAQWELNTKGHGLLITCSPS